MESKTFKKIVNDLLILKGFSKKGSYYYSFINDLIVVIGLQKSNFSKGYYINLGYIIRKLNPSLENPRDVDGDVRTRFSLEHEGKRIDYFDLERLLENEHDIVRKYIEENITQYIEPVTSIDKLKVLLQEKPVMLYQTKLSAKQLLGFE